MHGTGLKGHGLLPFVGRQRRQLFFPVCAMNPENCGVTFVPLHAGHAGLAFSRSEIVMMSSKGRPHPISLDSVFPNGGMAMNHGGWDGKEADASEAWWRGDSDAECAGGVAGAVERPAED